MDWQFCYVQYQIFVTLSATSAILQESTLRCVDPGTDKTQDSGRLVDSLNFGKSVMGLFTKRNPTERWNEQNFLLRVDLNALTLNTIACGDLADCLDFIGPGKHGLLKNEYQFPSKGLTLGIERELLKSFQIHLQPTSEEREQGMQPFVGEVIFEGKPRSLGAKVGAANLIAELGEPDVFEETDEQRILTYISFQREWELILDREGRVMTINVFG